MQQYSQLNLVYSRDSSKVYNAYSASDKRKVIIKMLKKRQLDSENEFPEAEIHQKLKHQNIVHLKNKFMHTEKGVKYLVLVLEYCSGGSLESFIPSHELDLVDRLAWAIDIAKGIEYLHQNKVIHRDIKPENIMLSRGRAKIGDLGISKYLGEEDPSDSRRLGSFWYASPETLQNEVSGYETDIWSFGIVCLEIVLNKRIDQLLEGQAPPAHRKGFPSEELLSNITCDKLKKLIKKMLNKKKEKRPEIAIIIQKLMKIHKKMTKVCQYQEVKIELPLEESELDHNKPLPEWIDRIQPSKQGQKAKFYTLKTVSKKDVEVSYDDYKETLRIKFEKMQIVYEYSTLPSKLKKYFKNLSGLNVILKLRDNKIEFGTSGTLVFNYRQRLVYDENNLLQKSVLSEMSSVTLQSNQQEDDITEKEEYFPAPKKIYDKSEPIAEILEEDENSSLEFGERISRSSKSSERKIEKKSQKYHQGSEHADNVILEVPEGAQNAPEMNQDIEIVQPSEIPPQRPFQQPSIPTNIRPPQAQQHQQQRFAPSSYHQPQQQSSSSNNQRIRDIENQIQVLKLVEGSEKTFMLPDQYVLLAKCYIKDKDLEMGEMRLREAIDHYQENQVYYSDKCSYAFYQLGKLYLKRDYQAKEEPQTQKEDVELLVEDLREKNLSSYKEKALGAFESALNILYSLNSYDFKAYCKVNNAIGELYLGSNHFLVAENYFSNAIMKTKDFSGEEKQLAFTPMLNLGKTYNKLKNYNEALPYLMQCEHIVQTSNCLQIEIILVLRELAHTYFSSKDYDFGLKYLEKLAMIVKSFEGRQKLTQRYIMPIFRKWTLTLLQLDHPSIKIYLIELVRIFQTYFPEQDGRIMTLKSRIENFTNG